MAGEPTARIVEALFFYVSEWEGDGESDGVVEFIVNERVRLDERGREREGFETMFVRTMGNFYFPFLCFGVLHLRRGYKISTLI